MTASVSILLECLRCGARHLVSCEQTSRPRTAISSCVQCNRSAVLDVPAKRAEPPSEVVDEASEQDARLEKAGRQAALDRARYGGTW
jgi:transcription elongation factor Elf1